MVPSAHPTRESSVGRLVFVGERRSRRAIGLGASWLDGRLAGKTLHAALRASGVDPRQVVFLNLFHDQLADRQPCENALLAIRSLSAAGATFVALGRLVQTALRRAGIAHVPLIHPAARGTIRARTAYQQHVRERLGASHVIAPG
jgi:hypothetical protein